jgi:hypothetical protein
MQRSNDLGFFYGPYGGVGYVERHAPNRLAGRFCLWRLFRRLLTYNPRNS